ncbi:MAG: flagellar basal body-associated FliL family protein [Thiomicrorhabdus sp.]|nr:flagellar basal body-associated FliL family protein [Thiomicrorhabdus sp.]
MAEEEVVEEKKKGGKGLIIALIVLIVLLLVGVGALAYLLLGSSSEESTAEGTEAHAPAEHGEPEEVSYAKTYSPKYKQFEPPGPEAVPLYFVMDKFVVNFNGEGKAKFLAVDLQFLSYYPQVVGPDGEMENLRPILKNDIQRLLRNQYFTTLNTPEGPDKLRAEILKVVHSVLEKHNVYPDLVEDVYMTRFVMQ